jgi:hypothetical protein
MWITVLVMAVAVSLEPFRIGMTVLMLNRPRPTLQLLAFLGGGFVMGTTVGLVVLFALRPRLVVSADVTLPRVQIAIGLLALLVAAVLATRVVARGSVRRAVAGGPAGVGPQRCSRIRHLLTGRSLWVAGAAGLGIALPSIDYLAVLAVILASGAAPMTQVGGLLTFNVVAFALVEIPLLAYLAAPDRTRSVLAAMQDRVRSRRRRAALLAVVGCVLLAAGIAGL